MELFKIVKDNKKSLRERSSDIPLPLDPKIKELGLSMLEYLKLSQDEEFLEKHKNVRSGVGLAAPQIGRNINLIAVYVQEEKENFELVLVNPKIISESTRECYLEGGEGCLSVDKQHEGYIYRPYKITLKAYDLINEKDITLTLTGYHSIVVQHEIDHLKGILFYDHINKKNPFFVKENAIKL